MYIPTQGTSETLSSHGKCRVVFRFCCSSFFLRSPFQAHTFLFVYAGHSAFNLLTCHIGESYPTSAVWAMWIKCLAQVHNLPPRQGSNLGAYDRIELLGTTLYHCFLQVSTYNKRSIIVNFIIYCWHYTFTCIYLSTIFVFYYKKTTRPCSWRYFFDYFISFFLALLAKGSIAYFMKGFPSYVVRRPSSVRCKQFSCCNDNSNKVWLICFNLRKYEVPEGIQVRIWAKSVNRNCVICPWISLIFSNFEV